MKQEIKLKLEEAADDYGFRVPYDNSMNFYDLVAIKHFKAGAQNILENPSEWGLCSLEIHKQAVKTFDKITTDAINAERAIVDERNRLQSQLAKLQAELVFYKRRADHDPNSPFNKLVNSVDKKLAQILDEQKKAGKKFISDEEVDQLIDKIVREELGNDTGRS